MIAIWMEAALRPLALALAVWAALRLFRVRNVLALKSVWILVLAAAFLAPFAARWPLATVVLPAIVPHAAPPAATVPAPAMASPRAPIAVSKLPLREQTPHPPESAHTALTPARRALPASPADRFSLLPVPREPLAAAPPARASSYSLGQMTAALYCAVAAALLFRLLYGLLSALRLWRSAKPVGAGVEARAAGLRLRASAAVTSPVTIGSAVLLPESHREWDAEKLRVVLAHERSHIRQGDFYLQVLAGLYAALVWFSPLGWWLKRCLSELGEALSDQWGLEAAASRSVYAQILLEFAAAPRPTRIGVAMARSTNLSQRIERLFDDRAFRQAYTVNRRTLFLAILVTVALFAATTLVQVEAATQAAQPQAAPAPTASARDTGLAAPAPDRKMGAPAPSAVPPIHVAVPPIHVNVPEQHVKVPAVHVNVPAQHIDVPAIHVSVPAVHVDVPAQSIDVPARRLDVPATHFDMPATHIYVPAIHLDLPSDAPQDGSGGHALLGSTGAWMAMLNGFP
ncbi:MAG: M56 family metallopeptidase, partial [Acidobacteriota bacterium]